VTETVVAIHSPLESTESTGARLKGRARGPDLRSGWPCVDVLGRSVRLDCMDGFVGVSQLGDDFNWWVGGVAGSSRSTLRGFRRRPGALDIYRPHVLDRHRCGMGVGCGRGRHIGALRALLGNSPIPLESLSDYTFSIRNVIACAGIGLPMWITAVVILSQD